MIGHRDAPDAGISKNSPSPEVEEPTPRLPRIGALLDYEIDVGRRVVSVKFRKRVTVREIEKYAASLRADPLFNPDFSEMVDMSDVEELDLSADEFIRLADRVDPFATGAKRAFVIRDAVQNHAARMHKILRMQPNFSIFHSVVEATRWLLEPGQREHSTRGQNSK